MAARDFVSDGLVVGQNGPSTCETVRCADANVGVLWQSDGGWEKAPPDGGGPPTEPCAAGARDTHNDIMYYI